MEKFRKTVRFVKCRAGLPAEQAAALWKMDVNWVLLDLPQGLPRCLLAKGPGQPSSQWAVP